MFRRIELEDRTWMERCRDPKVNAMTVLSFQAVFTWQDKFHLTIDGNEKFYVVRSAVDGGYYYPAGDRQECRKWVLDRAKEEPHLKLIYVPKCELEWLESAGFETRYERDTCEYVYSSKAFAMYEEGSSRNFREKVRHFYRDYNFSIRDIDPVSDKELILTYAQNWEREHTENERDIQIAEIAAQYMDAIDLSGIVIETDEGEWAFLLGYGSTDEIYDMTVVKTCRTISQNAVPTCFSELSKRVCDRYRYINLEDDMGSPGLRNVKTLYKPAFLLESYTAVRKGAK